MSLHATLSTFFKAVSEYMAAKGELYSRRAERRRRLSKPRCVTTIQLEPPAVQLVEDAGVFTADNLNERNTPVAIPTYPTVRLLPRAGFRKRHP